MHAARQLDYEPSPRCEHEDGLRCRKCTRVFRTADACDLPDLRKLAAVGGYRVQRHRGRHGVTEFAITPREPDENGEIVTYRLVVERVT